MKTILVGLFVGLVLASLLVVTIQAEHKPFSLSAAETPSLVTERWGANSTAQYPADAIDTTLNGLHPDWSADNSDTLKMRSGGGFDAWAGHLLPLRQCQSIGVYQVDFSYRV